MEQPPASVTPSSDQNHAQKPTPWWAIHRRIYDWVLKLAHSKNTTLSLFGISFAESSFFPIPPDVMPATLCLGNRKRSAWFATVSTIGSVLGAVLGYAIGYGFRDIAVMRPGINQENIDALANEFKERRQLYVFIAALTPIQFTLLPLTAGTAKMNLGVFLMACITERGIRFFAKLRLCIINEKAQEVFNLMKLLAVLRTSPNKLNPLPTSSRINRAPVWAFPSTAWLL